jgi:soluble lytic murein transglycosylase
MLHRSIRILLVCTLLCCARPAVAQIHHDSLASIPNPDPSFVGQLDKLAVGSGGAADFFRLKLAEARLKQGDAKAALKLADRVDHNAFSLWRSIVTAEALLSAGQPRKAHSALEDLPPRPQTELSFEETFYANLYKRALLVLKDAKVALGKNAAHESAELAANFPMDAGVADTSAHLSAEQKMVKLHALVFANEHKLVPGIITREEILASHAPHDMKCQSLFDLGIGLRRCDGMTPGAVAALQGVLKEKCDPSLEARALYWIGMSGRSVPDDSEVDDALQHLAKHYKGHRLQDDAYYLLYRRAKRRGDDALAQKYLGELMRLPKGDMRDRLAFDMAFPLYMKKDYAHAAETLEPLVGSEAADETFTQVLYWYARSLERMGGKKNLETARKVYARIVKQYPYAFYAVMAAERAGLPHTFPPLPALGGKPPSDDDGFFSIIDELNRAGQHMAARQVLDLAMQLNPQWEQSHEEFIARICIESQNYRKAIDMAAQHFDTSVYGPVEPQADPMFAAFFPRAFPQEAMEGYRLTGLPRGSIEGVMREESLFQTRVRSHAGAVGLMQLMPRTAAMVARGNAGGASCSDLTRPRDNVLLGASYLASMRERFGNRMPFAVMAYNAGPGNVNKFLRRLGKLNLDEFIENIPLSETRGYVKRVLRSQEVYAAHPEENRLGATKRKAH